MKRVPQDGIVGSVPMREAVATELSQIIDLVGAAVRAARRVAYPNQDYYCSIDSIFPDRAVAVANGHYYAYPYTINSDNTITLGEPSEVVVDYAPVGARVAEAAATRSGVFIEAIAAADASAPPSRYLVRVIEAGVAVSNINYPAACLREAVPLFNGTRVFDKCDIDHLKGDPKAKNFGQLVGKLSEPRFVEASGKEPAQIQAVLDVFEAYSGAAKLREAVARGWTDLFGLSIDAVGKEKPNGKFREAIKLTKVLSVDLIIDPGAGGRVIRFTEAQSIQESDMLREQMLEQIRQRDATRAAALASATDTEILTAYREAVQPATTDDATQRAAAAAGAPAAVTAADVDAKVGAVVRMVEARANARIAIAGSKLPEILQQRLVTRFTEAASFTDADVTTAIEGERALLSKLREGAQVRGLGESGRIEAGEDRSEKVEKMLDEFFDRKKQAFSFREAYVDITGDRRVTGLIADCDPVRLREAVGGGDVNFREAISAATFSDILGDSITRAMIRDYANLDAYKDWRWLCDIVPLSDFRTQERTRMGGYGNLPAVAENGPYNALTSPTDEAASYAATKRGGTETVSLETIANDDVGLLRRIPQSLAKAAARTLYEFVYDFMRTNAAIYDAVALAHASHSNIGTAALDATSFAAARLRMQQQTEKDSLKRLGLLLKHLVVPGELAEAAYNLFVRNTNQDETFVQSNKPTTHVVGYWTDANNWWATADNSDVPLIELGFYGGKEDPELFTQDLPTQGSLFSNDQIKYKIRHIYGGVVRDYRGFDGNIVA